MNRFLYILKSLFAIALVIIFPLSLLLVAYPKLPAEILSVGFYLFSIAVCFLIWERKIKINRIEFCTIFSLILYVQVIHISLLAQKSDEHLFIVRLFQQPLESDEKVLVLFLQFIMIIYIALFIMKNTAEISEANSRFSLDTMNTKFFDIDNKLTANEITENEATKLKNQVGTEADFYSEQKECFAVLFKCMTAFVVLTCIHLASGIGMDIFLRNELVRTAIFSNIPSVVGISSPFLVLYVVFGITVGIKKPL
ncbi:FHIPEP family type III secretion protein [Treponema socranskii]|uniref:FHIPEP family type III secretion protein n=1 Tax=Treponema socranskii TaxID=53419 RepID=UPI0036204EDB